MAGKLQDLWAYSPATNAWAQLASGPEGWALAAIAWDPVAKRMYISGGGNLNGLRARLRSYDVATDAWSTLASALAVHGYFASPGAAWDTASGRLLVFGGHTDPNNPSNALWAYTPASCTWSVLAPSGTAPPARAWHHRAYVYGPDLSLRGVSAGAGGGDLELVVDGAEAGRYQVHVDSPSGAVTDLPYSLAVMGGGPGALAGGNEPSASVSAVPEGGQDE